MAKDVIIACDFATPDKCIAFLDKFKNEERKPFLKIGMELYYAGGPEIVKRLKSEGYRIFLDLKLHDIPNTVKKTMKVLSDLDIDMVNVHASGTIEMMKAAKEGLTRTDGSRPLLIAVTQLTSTSEKAMREQLLIDATINKTIVKYAENAKEAGLDGVVCSPLEAKIVKEACGNDFLTVTPGIRFKDSAKDDQVRITDPAEARELGSDYIVVGRPITEASDPVEVWKRCLYEFTGKEVSTNNTSSATSENNDAVKVAESLLKIKAVFLRPSEPFTWASGIKSPIYCDNRLTLSYPDVRKIIETSIAIKVKEKFPEAEVLMGTSTAGIAHAAIAAWILGLPMGYVRSGNKDHGRGNKIEGKLEKGQKVVVIEDLISTAGSCIEVVETLREEGANVLGVISIFTYGMKKGLDRLEKAGVINYSLSDFETLCKVAVHQKYISSDEEKQLKKFMSDPSDESWMK